MALGLIGGLAVLLVLAVLGVVVGGVLFAMALARRSKADYDSANVTVPGRSAPVPESWGGSHDAEAVLHRRLVAAMAALRANQSFDDDGGLLDLRVSLEQQALDLDQRLVSVAALPAAKKTAPLSQAAEAVDHIEQAVADLATRTSTEAAAGLQSALDEAKERIALIDVAQAALDVAPAPTSAPATTTGPSQPPDSSTSQTGPTAPSSG